MSEAYIGEIRCFGFNFAPVNWAQCSGQLLPIQQYTALFSIIGTYYGGNGTSNFALPNLEGIAPMHWGNGTGLTPTVIGETLGTPTVTVGLQEIPSHRHTIQVFHLTQGAGTKTATPTSAAYIGNSDPDALYATTTPNTPLSPKAIGFAGNGGGLPHENMQPYLALNFCICLNGVFPPRS